MRPPSIPTTIPINRDSDSKQVVIMKSLYNSLIEYRDEQHRILIQLFMCLPSRKDFPEYFDIIAKPIAMNKIRERIERQQYQDEEACMEDFKLMFSNCKFFNEDDSQIYSDAVKLENVLLKKRERLQIEFSRPSRYSKEAAKEALLNNSTNPTATQNSNSTSSLNNTPTSSPAVKSERLNNHNNSNNTNNNNSNNNTNNHTTSTPTPTTAPPTNSTTPSTNNLNSPHSKDPSTIQQQESNNISTTKNFTTNSTTSSGAANNIINSSSYHTSTAGHNNDPSTPKSSTNNGINKDVINQLQSDSTNQSSTNDQHNGNDELEVNSIKINHNHHNEASMDSSSNLSADLLASTPVEKCSLNTRRGRNSDAPKRQLLTGYIIYASEIRKQVIDKNPNQNFGDISRLVGNEWKALPHDIRSKYDQRALIHNKRVRERAQRELSMDGSRLANGIHTPKMTKRKLAKLAKEQMRQHHLSSTGHDESSTQSPRISQEHSSSMVSQVQSSSYKHQHHQHSQPQANPQTTSSKSTTVESSTQTIAIRFVEPPTKKRLVYSDTFRKYIESLQVPNKDLLAEETTPERPAELPSHWLGAGIGRHESTEAALRALRDFMLLDAVTMRRSMEPYL